MTTTEDDRLLLNAYIDGELDPAHALEFERRLADDPALADERTRIEALRGAMRERLPRESASPELRRRIAAIARPRPFAADWGAGRGWGAKWGAKWGALMAWLLQQQYFRETLKFGPGGETGPVNDLLRKTTERIGANVMGKRMFEAGERSWPAEAPFHTPVYVLTHEKREP